MSQATARSLSTGIVALLALLNAAGQEAVFNAVSVDNILAQNVSELKPDQPHLGPVQLSYGLYAGTEYNDNVFATQSNPQADTLLRGGVNLGLYWPATERSVVQFSTGVGYLHYFNHSQIGGVEITPNSALTWAIDIEDCTLSLYDQFSYQQQVLQEASVANTATIPRLDNLAGVRADWEPGQWVALGDYSHEDFLSTSSVYDYLDRSSENLFGRAGWRFAENTQAGLEASTALTSYRQHILNDNTSFSVGGYAEWHATQTLHVTLRGGPTFYHFDASDSAPASDLNTYYIMLNVNHSLTQFISQQLNVSRDVSLGLEAGSSFVEQLTTTYSINFALTQHVSVGANVTYAVGNQPLLIPTPFAFTSAVLETENFSRDGFGGNFSWSFTDHLFASIRYEFWQRTSNLPDRGYDQNVASLQLNYNF
jgi:hypothetical protein